MKESCNNDSMELAIIGAGAAGLMATATILEHQPNAHVTLIEKNAEIGKKVLISGGGRCNVTTGIFDVPEVLTRYPRGRQFLTKALYHFPPTDVISWFEDHGVSLKIEEDLRVFPVSDDGHDVVGAFERVFKQHEARFNLLTNTSVKSIERVGDRFAIHTSRQDVMVDRVILTTGGQAYRHTGSTGDGYAFAESLGHTITPLAPSLSALHTLDAWPKMLAGVSLETVRIVTTKTPTDEWSGPLLFTHHGITGPAVFAFSALTAFQPISREQPLHIALDFFEGKTHEALYEDVKRAIREHGARQLVTVVALFLPKSLATIACMEVEVPTTTPCHDVSDKEIRELIGWMKHAPLRIVSRSAGDEFVTAGGVDTHEVNPQTMESLKCPGVFFAGEILNVDGFTGGFNLQASWATGRMAGTASSK